MEGTISRQKQKLRETMHAILESLPAVDLHRADIQIQKRVLALSQWKQARTIFIYVGTGREPQTVQMIQAALDAGKTAAIPRTLENGVMEARSIRSLDELHPGRRSIPEPDSSAPLVLPEDIDLVVAPCVAADRFGYRLGHGGGYYDRYLAGVTCPVVCLCRTQLIQDELPHDMFDRPVDVVITERECITRN